MSHLNTLKGLVLGMALATPALATAATEGPSGMDFYDVPAISTTTHGDLIWYREATVDLGAGVAGFNAWNVMYRSTDSLGAQNAVTGTVLVPTSGWGGLGDRPVVSYATGTHGLQQGCAPSLQLEAGTDYEAENIKAVINAGYAVLITDYAGYTTGDVPTYLAGESQAHAALDILRAASQVPGTDINEDDPFAIWGYSQGGQTATWAAELAESYLPDLNLKGVAAGGVPADFPLTADYLNGSTGASFLLGAVIGLAEQYPDNLDLDELTNDAGKDAIERGKNECVFEALFDFMNDSIQQYTANGETLDEMLEDEAIYEAVAGQNLGDGKPSVPMYQYHGQADEFIPISQHTDLKSAYCSKFANVTFDIYPSEHIVTQFQAAPQVLDWLDDRFSGYPAFNGCLTFSPAPESTANPGGGDFVVTLDQWFLDGTMHLATLDQEVVLPEESTMTADTNITQETMVGALNVPDFQTSLRIAGIKTDVWLSIQQVGDIEGDVSLDNDGILSIDGSVMADIVINAVGRGFAKIPFRNCKTEEPVLFDLNYAGPISDLGSGQVSFSGDTYFPDIEGCSGLAALFTALMSGPGQEYTFRIEAPAPEQWQ